MVLGVSRGLLDEFAALQACQRRGVEGGLPYAWPELLLPLTSATTSPSC